ncbi:MAG: hypothetical protein GX921_05180 [Bacteroidales bacterium]|nr:hypothetical protein [Bacteroidales bacterium]
MFKEIVLKIVRIITAPEDSWSKLSASESHQAFINRYLHPIFGVISLTSFIGGLWIIQDGNIESALKSAIINLVTVYGGYYIGSYILNEYLPRLGIAKDESKVQQFVGYSSALMYALFIVTPFFPSFIILRLFALYTIYIVYTGYGVYIVGEEENRMHFTGVATTLILLTPVLIMGILSILIK